MAVRSLGRLTLDLVMKVGGFQEGMSRAQRGARSGFRSIEADAKRLARNLGVALGGAVTGIAVAMRSIIREQAPLIDNLAKTSDALNVNIADLQALQQIAGLTGTSAEQLSTNMERMQRRLGQVAREGGPAARALEDLGLNVAELVNMSGDKQLEALAQALAGVENQTIRASIAADLFGRDGVRMLKLLDQLAADGLGPIQDELEALGFALDREGAARVEQMNDALQRLGNFSTGLRQTLTVELAPAISAVAETLIEAAKETAGFRSEIKSATEGLVTGFGFALDAVVGFERVVQIVGRGAVVQFATLTRAVLQAADAIINGPNRAIDGLLRLISQIPGINIEFRFGSIPGTAALQRNIELQTGVIREALAEIDEILQRPLPGSAMRPKFEAMRLAAADAAADIESRVNGIFELEADGGEALGEGLRRNLEGDAERLRRMIETSQEAYQRQLEWARELRAENAITLEEFQRFEAHIRGQLIPALEEIKEAGSTGFSELEEFARQALRNIQNLVADLFMTWDGGLSNVLRSFVRTVHRMAAELMAQQALRQFFGSGVGQAIGGRFGLDLGGLLSRDSGGRGRPGQGYLIGTGAQPELFVPDQPGTFIPAGAWGGMGGAQITIAPVVQAPEGRISREAQGRLEAATAQALAQAMRRFN